MQRDQNPKLPSEKIEPQAMSTISNAKFDDNFDVSFIFYTLATGALLAFLHERKFLSLTYIKIKKNLKPHLCILVGLGFLGG